MKDPADQPDPLAALAAGDPVPFESFVRASAERFLGFFQTFGVGAEEAEELTQGLFVRLYEHRNRYRPEGRFEAFCFRAARNALADRARRRTVRGGARETDELVDRASDDEPGAELERREEAGKLGRALARLPEGQRRVFELAVVEGWSYGDIAQALEVPVGTVKSRMHHAVRRLREAMDTRNLRARAKAEGCG